MQRRVVELLGRVEHRQLTQLLLAVNDNINNQLLRYERYNNNVPPAAAGPAGAAAAASAVTSTDDVLLEVAAGPGGCSVALYCSVPCTVPIHSHAVTELKFQSALVEEPWHLNQKRPSLISR